MPPLLRAKSNGGGSGDTVSVNEVVWVIVPLTPVTVTVEVPGVAVAAAVSVTVVGESCRERVGFCAAVTPAGKPEPPYDTACAAPHDNVAVTGVLCNPA